MGGRWLTQKKVELVTQTLHFFAIVFIFLQYKQSQCFIETEIVEVFDGHCNLPIIQSSQLGFEQVKHKPCHPNAWDHVNTKKG